MTPQVSTVQEEEQPLVQDQVVNDQEAQLPRPKLRITALDALRGLLMIFESLDHAREFLSDIHIDHEEWYNMPQFQNYEYPLRTWALRQVTSWCAPGFMFLMGMSIVFFKEARTRLFWSDNQVHKHFLVRGCKKHLRSDFGGAQLHSFSLSLRHDGICTYFNCLVCFGNQHIPGFPGFIWQSCG